MSKLDPNQAAADFVSALQQGGSLRAQALARLDQLHRAQGAALAVEQSRTALRYGAKSTQTQAIGARLAAHAASARVYSAEIRRAQVAVPTASATAAIVYGLALDSSGAPLPSITVTAVADTLADVARTKTDANGTFELDVPIPAPPAAGAPAVSPPQSFKLTLTGDEVATYRDTEVFALKGQVLAYREIVMPGLAKSRATKPGGVSS
jgi:hypothetical protein